MLLEVLADLAERAALAVADRHDEVGPGEDHHLADLDELLRVDVARRLQHAEERVVVHLDLRPLGGVGIVLDGEWMEPEMRGDGVDDLGARVLQADPGEAVGAAARLRKRRLQLNPAALPLPALVETAVDDMRADLGRVIRAVAAAPAGTCAATSPLNGHLPGPRAAPRFVVSSAV